MKSHLLAKRYARALFQLSERDGTSEKMLTGLQEILALLEQESRIRIYLYSAAVNKKLKIQLVKTLLKDTFSPVFLNFMLLLVHKGRPAAEPNGSSPKNSGLVNQFRLSQREAGTAPRLFAADGLLHRDS